MNINVGCLLFFAMDIAVCFITLFRVRVGVTIRTITVR